MTAAAARVAHAFAPADAFSAFDAKLRADRERLLGAVSPSCRLVETHQTHSANVAVVTADTTSAMLASTDGGIDALVTREPDVLLHAISADCPLAYFVDATNGAVGIAHCGWKGTVRGIVERTIDALVHECGADPRRLVASVSPGASSCCYEVGPEVVNAFAELGADVARITRPSVRAGHVMLDLKRSIAWELERNGVAAERIEVATECSICGGSRFHSHRVTPGRAGRMSGVIGLVPRRP